MQLLEYNNIEGMVLLSELSRRRIRSINKLIKVGRDEVVMVIRVDKEKGYIDLSKRRVSAEEIVKAEDRFNKAKMAHSILKHVSQVRAGQGGARGRRSHTSCSFNLRSFSARRSTSPYPCCRSTRASAGPCTASLATRTRGCQWCWQKRTRPLRAST